jgi:succinate-semialdehyde dehydrogenase/glutarate-semialdehyde dehydrogenase
MDKRKLFIDGDWCEGGSAETIEVTNPATDEIVALVCCADKSDLDRALEAADRGFKVWSKTSPWERSKILNRCAALIEERIPELAVLMTLEQGKPLAESRGELDRTVDVFQWCAGEAIRTYGRLLPQRHAGYRQTTIKELSLRGISQALCLAVKLQLHWVLVALLLLNRQKKLRAFRQVS